MTQIVNDRKILSLLSIVVLFSVGIGAYLFAGNTPRFGNSTISEASVVDTSNVTSPDHEIVDGVDTMTITGIGIMGYSEWDEYRADDNRGGTYADTTLNPMEQLALSRELNFGPWGTWDEPRRSGYKYNWARSGTTTRNLIASGQHTGLAQQVANGEVSHVFVSVGQNDFSPLNGSYNEIYSGTLSDAELQAKIDGVVSDITTVVDTILAEKLVPIVIVTISDPGLIPDVKKTYPNPINRKRVTEAISSVNTEIRDLAQLHNIAIADKQAAYEAIIAQVDEYGFIDIDGEQISVFGRGNEPHFGRLGDNSGLLGTVVSGLLANSLFVEPFNRGYGMEITPLSDQEILANAGIVGADLDIDTGIITGIGIMGYSNWDEYRADDNRGGRYADTTLNPMEQLALRRELNFGPWGTWDEPRRSGYKYNWARSGATAKDLIASGQHTGLAQQVANGEVSHVFISIGQSDFSPLNGNFVEIYDGELSDAEVQAKIDGVVADITTAVDTILAVRRVPVVITTIVDLAALPNVKEAYPDPVKRERVTEAITSLNEEIKALASRRDISVADEQAIYEAIFAQIDENGFFEVGGEQIRVFGKGNEPHFGWLGDPFGHPGTVLSGLLANSLFIEPFNRGYGMEITPLSDQEILANASMVNSKLHIDTGTITGIGIMGCSDWDEYRADDDRGGRYANTTLNPMEQLALSRELNFGPWGTWDEPRRSGYKYNWARSGAKARDLIESGQHTGLAEQVANGEVSHVFMYIGQNDFSATNGSYKEIYSGALSNAELQAKIDGVVIDITTAVDTILAVKQVPMVITTIPDPGKLPFDTAEFPDPEKRQRVTRSIDIVNAEIEAMADARSIQVVDIQSVYAALLAQANAKGFVDVGGEQINALSKGNEPHNARLGDRDGHVGTVGSGLLANLLFVEPFNRGYGMEITPLSEQEILVNAGIIVP